MTRRLLKSPCCNARVLALVDVTVHPIVYKDGTTGAIVDTLGGIRRSAATLPADTAEAYCDECGAHVPVEEAR